MQSSIFQRIPATLIISGWGVSCGAPLAPHSPLQLGHTRGGFIDRIGNGSISNSKERPVEHAASIDNLLEDPRVLAATTYLLATDLFQIFGWPECNQLTRDGQMQLRYWGRNAFRGEMEKWATDHGIDITE